MSRYDPLRAFLARCPEAQQEVRLTFADLENLVGPLPASARNHRPWWANSVNVQAQSWRQAGWILNAVNLTAEHVVFTRDWAQRAGAVRHDGVYAREHPRAARGPEEDNSEAAVQGRIVTHLANDGWQIQRVADTASRESGIDILATKANRVLAVEVKGFPSTGYADPRRAAEVKPTIPATQARHWYAQALLKVMLTRDEHPEYEIAIGLPEAPTYRSLVRRTARSLERLGIQILFVAHDGRVHEDEAAIGG